MSIYIHQVGEFVLRTESTNLAPLRVDLSRSFRGAARQSAMGIKTTYTQSYQLPDPQDVEISGTIICDNCISVSDQINRMMSLGGVPYIDIIGYLPNACCGSGECTCGSIISRSGVRWVTTTGMITKISRAVELSDSGNHPGSAMEVTLSLSLDPYWYPLNHFQWDVIYGTDAVDDWEPLDSLSHFSGYYPLYPSRRVVFKRKHYSQFHLPYVPTLWTYEYYDQDEYVVSPLQTRVRSYSVYPNAARWSAPAASIYAFRNLTPTGTISIDVQSVIAPGNRQLSQSFLSLDVLDSLLDDYGHGGLLGTDIILATEGLYTPGFILRAGAPLTYLGNLIIPEWSYPDEAPGQLLGRNCTVTFENLPSEYVETAWLHTYRML